MSYLSRLLPNFAKFSAAASPAPDTSEAISSSLSSLIRLRADAHALGLTHRNRVTTAQSGGYVSAYKGRGIDFEETRIYQPGDDVRTIDWRVTARTGEAHTKIFREERERPVLFLVDQSSAMAFGTRRRFKRVVAARAAALIAWAAIENGDRVGGVVYNDRQQVILRPTGRRRAVLRLCKAIVSVQEIPGDGEPVTLAQSLESLGRLTHAGALVFVLSDFRQLDDMAKFLIDRLARECDLTVMLVHDPAEARAPQPDVYAISNGLAYASFDTRDHALVQAFEQRFQARLQTLKSSARAYAGRFVALATDEPLVPAIRRGLRRGGR